MNGCKLIGFIGGKGGSDCRAMDNCGLAVEDCVAAKEDGTTTTEDCAVEVTVVGLCGVLDFWVVALLSVLRLREKGAWGA